MSTSKMGAALTNRWLGLRAIATSILYASIIMLFGNFASGCKTIDRFQPESWASPHFVDADWQDISTLRGPKRIETPGRGPEDVDIDSDGRSPPLESE